MFVKMELRHMETWKEGFNQAISEFDWRWTLALVVVTYAVYEQLSFMSKRKHLPGPTLVIPFLGNVISMVVDPTGFWNQQAVNASKVSLIDYQDYSISLT